MGFRFRKSISLGLGFRVNLSKSGVGYSWGGKGFRVTKTAKGRTRTTASIPGTGLSWVNESGGKRKGIGWTYTQAPTAQNSSSHLYSVESADASEFVSAQLQDFINAIKRYRNVCALLTWVVAALFIAWVFVLTSSRGGAGSVPLFFAFIAAGLCKIIHKFAGKVKTQYAYDEYGQKRIDLIQSLIRILQSSNRLWQVNDVFFNRNTKANAGAAQSVNKFLLRIIRKKPPFLRTNARCYFVKLKKEKLYILPDKILVVSGRTVGVIDLSELDMVVGDVRFVEYYKVPKDATVIDHTWQFVNKNGAPDGRYKANRQLPICRYGTISFKTSQGFNLLVHCSNINAAVEFLETISPHVEQR